MNKYTATKPKDVNGTFMVTRTAFYRTELMKLVGGIFKIECPADWDKDYMRDTLLRYGYLIVSDTDFGVLPLQGALQGYNYFNNPTDVIINVPLIPGLHKKIGTDCELLYIQRIPQSRIYYNFVRIVDIYAQRLASADAAIDVNLMNSRVAYIAEAETKAQAESIKTAYDKISNGEPLVVYRKDVALNATGLNVFFNNVKQNYIADMVQDSKRTIINEFLTAIGVNNANTDKRERLVTGEVDANNQELVANTAIWKENLKLCCDKINTMFNVGLNVTLQFDASNREESKDDVSGQRESVDDVTQ